jgi:hypothetical protein
MRIKSVTIADSAGNVTRPDSGTRTGSIARKTVVGQLPPFDGTRRIRDNRDIANEWPSQMTNSELIDIVVDEFLFPHRERFGVKSPAFAHARSWFRRGEARLTVTLAPLQ